MSLKAFSYLISLILLGSSFHSRMALYKSICADPGSKKIVGCPKTKFLQFADMDSGAGPSLTVMSRIGGVGLAGLYDDHHHHGGGDGDDLDH